MGCGKSEESYAHLTARHHYIGRIIIEQGRVFHVFVTPDPGYTPISLAAQQGHASIVELRLKNGADPNHRDWLASPILWAAYRAQLDIARLLIANGTLF